MTVRLRARSALASGVVAGASSPGIASMLGARPQQFVIRPESGVARLDLFKSVAGGRAPSDTSEPPRLSDVAD
jgi:hypothetical protein